MAATKALDALFHVDPPPAAKKLRELFYSIFYATDHTTHFYALGGPDFVVGPDAPPAERNILGVIKKVGMDVAGKVLKMRRDGHALIKMIGGRAVHPNWGLPGGVSRGIDEEQRDEIEARGREAIEFAKFSLQGVRRHRAGQHDLRRAHHRATSTSTAPTTWARSTPRTASTSTTARSAWPAPDGKEHAKYAAADYRQYVAERVEPWTYLKFPYLKKIGWKGFVDGDDSGVYKATPLSRCNAADGMATPLAQAEYKRIYDALGGKPVHHTLATHWARLIELLYADRALGRAGHRSADHQQGISRAAHRRRRPTASAASRPRAARSPTTTRPTSAASSPRST